MSCTISDILEGIDIGKMLASRHNKPKPSKEEMLEKLDKLRAARKTYFKDSKNAEFNGNTARSYALERQIWQIDIIISELELVIAQYDTPC